LRGMTEPVRGPFGRVGVGVPYFKAQYEFFRWWSWLIAGGLELGDQLLNNENLLCEVPIPMAHNGIVREFLKTDLETLLIIEDDHFGDQEVIRRMRNKPENWEFDIVCASYTNRRPPTITVGFDFGDDCKPNEQGEYLCELDFRKVTRTGTQQYDGAALGCVLIRRSVLVALLGDNDPEEFSWFEWVGRNSQDVNFYGRVKALGWPKVGVDRDNDIAHIGKVYYTMNDFYVMRQECVDRMEKEQQEETNGSAL
jgi:hypothetical protein